MSAHVGMSFTKDTLTPLTSWKNDMQNHFRITESQMFVNGLRKLGQCSLTWNWELELVSTKESA